MRITNIGFLTFLVIIFNTVNAGTKYYDGDNKPYDFGFKIEGNQHRHESKDENGIINGEFGFITADGVYHQTVYGTDENGNFRILSRKSYKLVGDDSPSQKKRESKAEKLVPELPVIVLAPKLSTPEKDADTLLSGDLISDAKPIENEKPLELPVINAPPQPSPFEVHPPIVESFHIPSIDLPPPLPVHEHDAQPLPVHELNTQPFLPPKPILIIEPNQFPLEHDTIPVVIVTPSEPVATTTVAATQSSTEKETTIVITTAAPVVTTTEAAPIIITEKSSAIPIETTSPTTIPNISVETSTAADIVTTKKPEIELTTTEKATTPAEVITTTTTVKPEEPIIIQDLVPLIESPLKPLFDIVDQVVEKALPLIQHPIVVPDENVPAAIDSSISTPEPIVEALDATTVPPPRPKAFIRSINADLIRQVSPSARKFLNAKEEAILDLNDMLYKFNYTAGFHGHMEEGDMAGSKNGEYFIVGRDNIKRTVKYTASKHGFVPSIRFGPVEDDTAAPKPETEKEFGMRGYEFKWYAHKLPETQKNSINDK